jgi:hypothetical protein
MSAPIGPGDLVLCIDASVRGHGPWEPGAKIVEGAIYTVVEVFIGPVGEDAFELSEARRGPEAQKFWGARCGYAADRFVPIRKPKSDFIQSLKQPAPEAERELLTEDA